MYEQEAISILRVYEISVYVTLVRQRLLCYGQPIVHLQAEWARRYTYVLRTAVANWEPWLRLTLEIPNLSPACGYLH